MARGPTLPSAFPEVGAASGGAKLISRMFNASGNISVPSGAGYYIARCLGAGAAGSSPSSSVGYGGGGGAFSKKSGSCSPTDAFVATPGAPCTSSTTANLSTLKQNGNIVCAAESGYAATASANGKGGVSANGVGDILRSGGNPTLASNSTYNQPIGTYGPSSNPNTAQGSNTNLGGFSAGDNGDTDAIGIGSSGFNTSSLLLISAPTLTEYGHGANGSGTSSGVGPLNPGQVAIEFWSAKA